jgi:hypothetical protein
MSIECCFSGKTKKKYFFSIFDEDIAVVKPAKARFVILGAVPSRSDAEKGDKNK